MSLTLQKVLIALKNGAIVNKKFILLNTSEQSIKLIELLYKNNYILSYKIESNKLKVFLFNNNLNIFRTLKIFSNSFSSKNLKYIDLCRLIYKHKEIVLSTPFGYLTGQECKKLKIGGKALFII